MRCGAKEAKRRKERVRLQRDLYETKREEVVQLLLSHGGRGGEGPYLGA